MILHKLQNVFIGNPLERYCLQSIQTNHPFESSTGRYYSRMTWQSGFKNHSVIHGSRVITDWSFMCQQNGHWAWKTQRKPVIQNSWLFPPVDILVWLTCSSSRHNIPIHLGSWWSICAHQDNLDFSVYEPSNSSYQLHWFCSKEDGKTYLQIVPLVSRHWITHYQNKESTPNSQTPLQNNLQKLFMCAMLRICLDMLNG